MPCSFPWVWWDPDGPYLPTPAIPLPDVARFPGYLVCVISDFFASIVRSIFAGFVAVFNTIRDGAVAVVLFLYSAVVGALSTVQLAFAALFSAFGIAAPIAAMLGVVFSALFGLVVLVATLEIAERLYELL